MPFAIAMNSALSSFVASVALVAACGFTADALASREPVKRTRVIAPVAAPHPGPGAARPAADDALAAAAHLSRNAHLEPSP